jgi:hypothetical protein
MNFGQGFERKGQSMSRDDERRGNIFEETDGIFHPHLNPPPSRGRRFFSFPPLRRKVRMGVI